MIARRPTLFLVVATLAANSAGCAALFGIQDLPADDGGEGGATGDASSGDATTDGPPVPEDGSRDGGSRDGDASEAAPGDGAPPDDAADAQPEAEGDAEGGPASEAGCPAGSLTCDGGCVPSDTRNCGACGHDCNSLPNVSGTVACGSDGVCAFDGGACAQGYAHCSGSADRGCETPIDTASHCGSCGTACSGGTPNCAGSGSSYSCTSGCPAGTPTLCGMSCVDTTVDAKNCKTCGNVCTTSVAHATATCASSACTFVCNGSYTPCAGGCADFSNDSANCGSCGNACKGGKTCVGGGCQCGAGMLDCGGTCEAPGPQNGCGKGGACGAACPGPSAGSGSAACNGTSCSITCAAPTSSLCGGNACVDTNTDPANCGSCGHNCQKGTCSGGLCQGWVVAQTPTTSSIAAVVTDGTNVIWADTGLGKLLQIPAMGGGTTTLATGGVGSSLSMGGGTLIYGDGTNLASASVGVPNSDNPIATGNIPNSTINPAGTNFWFNTFSSGWRVVDQPVGGSPIGNTGSLHGPLVADGSYAFCSDAISGQFQREVPGSNQWNSMAITGGTNLAVAGGYLYWLDASGTVTRIQEGTVSGLPQTVQANVSLFATDGTNVYFPSGTTMQSTPVAGGSAVKVATISGCSLIAVGGTLLVWVSGSTIYGRLLP